MRAAHPDISLIFRPSGNPAALQICVLGRQIAGHTTMRKEFVVCHTRSIAARKCPWAVVIAAVDGGFMCFESRDDYQTWKRQT
jgi:hypothetical protein